MLPCGAQRAAAGLRPAGRRPGVPRAARLRVETAFLRGVGASSCPIAAVTSSIGRHAVGRLVQALAAVIGRKRRGLGVIGVEALLERFGVVVGAHRLASRLHFGDSLLDPLQQDAVIDLRARSRRRAASPSWRAAFRVPRPAPTVRGKPSRMKPCWRRASAIRSSMIAITTSSGTSSPRAMMSFARWPTGVPAATAARNMSPVESWTIPCLETSRCACVPLPAPGGPSRISLIACRPRNFDFLIRPSYWCASRWPCTCATVSMVTLTTIRSDVPPK